ncbi:MAG: response regulator [Armatimonadota bacterium]|nr:response regulator [Armatimonadota bacterium]
MGFEVLVVDDDVKLVEVLTAVLSSMGCDVTCVHSGAEALKLLDKRRYDLMLADLRMPKMDGVGLLKAVPLFQADARCVLMSAYITDESMAEARNNGVYDCLRKPFKLSELSAVVERARAESGQTQGPREE